MQGRNQKIRKRGRQEGSLSNMLREYYLQGCEISVQGKRTEPWKAAECLREPSGYMMDFIPDEDNKRIVHIDLVKLGKNDCESVPGDEPEEEDDMPAGACEGWCG